MKYCSIGSVPLLAALLLGGCSENLSLEAQGCSSDDECGGNQVCSTTFKQCMAAVEQPPSLEVWPPNQNSLALAPQEFPQGTLGADGHVAAKLQASVSIEGRVYASDTDSLGNKKYIRARVVAWRESDLPGRPMVQFETQTPGTVRKDGTQDSFVLWLNRGHTYTFHVTALEPLDLEYPPLVVTGLKIADHLKRDFVLDGRDRAVDVTGSVLDSTGRPLGFTVRVRASRADGLYKSTLAETDPKTGSFSFKVPAGVASYTLRVESANGDNPIPTLECSDRTVGLIPATGTAQNIGEIHLPGFQFAKSFTLAVKGGDSSPVAQASLTLSANVVVPKGLNSSLGTCVATFTQSATTGADGKVALMLLPGSTTKNQVYTATVVSPSGGPFASQRIAALEVGPSGGLLQDIVLERRYQVSGRVLGADTLPVKGAAVEAQPIISIDAVDALPGSSAATTSGKDGAYELYVDPGIYNIEVRPPQESLLPSSVLSAAPIRGDTALDLNVPEPRVLQGIVEDPLGQPLASAQVMAYDLVPGTQQPITHRAALRAQAITDSRGTFSLVLPPARTED